MAKTTTNRPESIHWPADQIERRPLADLIPYARNARLHSDSQVSQIAASIREWGWTTPILVAEDNTIIAGHGRALAAEKLGLADVPVKKFSDLPPSVQKNGVKDVICEDCSREFTVRKDTKPKVCKRCATSRGGRGSVSGIPPAKKRKVPTRLCPVCGSEIKITSSDKYCSVECRKIDKRESRVCKKCGKTFFVLKSSLSGKTNASGNFCSRQCYESWLCKTDRVTGRGTQWKKERDESIRRTPFCALCGTTKNLQVHHIIPFRLSFDNSLVNLIPLCVKHHRYVESVFVSTENAGDIDVYSKMAWQGMLRDMQRATAIKIMEILRDK